MRFCVMLQLMIAILLSVSAVRAQDPSWDVAGVQGRVGFIVNSGLGEPLSIQLTEMKPDALRGSVAMRIYAQGQRLGLHMGREMDADTAIILPECTDSVMIVVLQGRNFDSELEPVDTGYIELTPRPIAISLTTLKLERPPKQPLLVLTGVPVLGSTKDQTINMEITKNTLRDTAGLVIDATITGKPEKLAGSALYRIEIATRKKAGPPYSAKLSGSLEFTITYTRTVCGQIVRKTLTKVIALPDR